MNIGTPKRVIEVEPGELDEPRPLAPIPREDGESPERRELGKETDRRPASAPSIAD